MRTVSNDLFEWNGDLYVPFNNAPLSCGSLLDAEASRVEKHLVLPPTLQLGIRDNFVGSTRSVWPPQLGAAKTVGDSMNGEGVYSGNVVLFVGGVLEWADRRASLCEPRHVSHSD